MRKTKIICTIGPASAGGEISDHKGMNFPGRVFKGDFLSEADKSDLLFGIENDIDFVAASFVSNKENVSELRNFLDENGGKDIDIIAKIENRSGVDNIDEICEIAEYTEKNIDYVKRFYRTDYVIKNNLDALSHATCAMAIDTKAKGIVISSMSGITVRMVSRFRCPVDRPANNQAVPIQYAWKR